MFKKPTFKVLIAHPKDDQDTILGYLACELTDSNTTVHFSFVKEAFRRLGVAKTLYQHAEVDFTKMRFTAWTFPVDEFIKKYPEMIYDPYKL